MSVCVSEYLCLHVCISMSRCVCVCVCVLYAEDEAGLTCCSRRRLNYAEFSDKDSGNIKQIEKLDEDSEVDRRQIDSHIDICTNM